MFLQFMNDAGIVGWLIILTGLLTAAIIIERFAAYYSRFALHTEKLYSEIESLILQGQNEKAILICEQNQKKPLAYALKKILEKSDRDSESIYQAENIAQSEVLPLYQKNIHYLAMFANVATLLGLLGTIHGLILSFQAVAQADPAQKQALLAHGISVSMYTTALGLAVAIPAMIFSSVLVAKQNELVETLTILTQKTVEILTSGRLPMAHESLIYKENQEHNPPPFQKKAN